MKLSQTSRVSFFTVLLLTLFTVGIGGITVKHSLDVEVQKVDQSLGFVALSAYENPGQAVGAALFAIEQSNLDATLTLLARDGSETLINESTLQYPGAPALREVEKAVRSAVRVSAETPFRIRTVPLEGGDFIIIALSTSEIDANFISDLQYLALVTLILNSFAAGLLFLYFRRERRTADSASLARMQEFLGDASHELRTPLTTIKLSVAILDQQRDELPPNALRSLDTLQSQLTRFDALLSDLLEISRYDAGAVSAEFETTDLNGVVGMALAHIEPLASSRSCDLVVDIPSGPVNAEIDARRIERVLRNLLSNAIEHGEGKPIEVHVGASDTAVAVTVTDHGVGMSRTELDRVFDRFWRADPSRKRTVGGTGLGLSIATEDTNIHNGWLQATSKPGEGSTFRLTLPRTQGVLFTQSPLPLTTKTAAAKKDGAS